MSNDIKQELMDQVRIKRVTERKNQAQLSAELGISRTYLSLYETGRLSVSDNHKAILNDYLNA